MPTTISCPRHVALLVILSLWTPARAIGQGPVAAPADPCQGMTADREEDRFTGDISAVASTSPRPMVFDPLLIWSSEKGGSTLVFDVIGSADSWRYLDCHPLAILVDGKRIPMGPSSHKGDVLSGFVMETVSALIAIKDAGPLATATKIEFKLCNDEFVASQEFVCKVREVLKVAAEWHAARSKVKAGKPRIHRRRVAPHRR